VQTWTLARAQELLDRWVSDEKAKQKAKAIASAEKAGSEAKSGPEAVAEALAAAAGAAAGGDSKASGAQLLLLTVAKLANPQKHQIAAALKETLPSPAQLGQPRAAVVLL
jgi:hypothetical protein